MPQATSRTAWPGRGFASSINSSSNSITSFSRNVLGFNYRGVFEVPKDEGHKYGLLAGLLVRSNIYWKDTGFNFRFGGVDINFLSGVKALTDSMGLNSSKIFESILHYSN